MNILIDILLKIAEAIFGFLLGTYTRVLEHRLPTAHCPRCKAKGAMIKRQPSTLWWLMFLPSILVFVVLLITGGAFLIAGFFFTVDFIERVGQILGGLLLILLSMVTYGILIYCRDRQPPISCQNCHYCWYRK